MNDNTVASKLNRLLQKSRQAYRIYSAMSKNAKAECNFYSELQANEWMKINADLVRQLSLLIEGRQFKNLHQNVSRIRLGLEEECLRTEQQLESEQEELVACSKRGDFVRSAQLATNLISKKGFIQAARAAVYELHTVCGSEHSSAIFTDTSEAKNINSDHIVKANVNYKSPHTITDNETDQADFYNHSINQPSGAKIIQLRR